MERSHDELSSGEPGAPDQVLPLTADITQWLNVCSEGETAALERLLPLVYDELHRQAMRAFGRERRGHTLQPTALVHEAYLRLIEQHQVDWMNRAQFFPLAAQMMRRILIDHAKTRHRGKRGGDGVKLSLDDAIGLSDEGAADLLALVQEYGMWIYAILFGILLVGMLGVLGYVGILAAWLVRQFGPQSLRKLCTLAIWGMSIFGVAFSIYLTFLEPFVIGATCAWCLTSAAIMTILMLLTAGPAGMALQADRIGQTSLVARARKPRLPRPRRPAATRTARSSIARSRTSGAMPMPLPYCP